MGVTPEIIARAVALLREAAPSSTIILFGSHARGDARPDSDVDFLVVEPEVGSRHAEMVRLRDVLRPLRIPVDVLVASRRLWQEWSGVPGTVLHAAATEGRVLHGAA